MTGGFGDGIPSKTTSPFLDEVAAALMKKQEHRYRGGVPSSTLPSPREGDHVGVVAEDLPKSPPPLPQLYLARLWCVSGVRPWRYLAPFASLFILLCVAPVWLYGQTCHPPGSLLPSLPFPPHFRRGVDTFPAAAVVSFPTSLASSSSSSHPPLPPPLLDLVFVSAFPQHLLSSMRSVCHFLRDGTGLGSVHLVVPDRMVAYFQASLPHLQCPGPLHLHFRVWPESTLVPHFTLPPTRHGSTVRQMTLKLAVSRVVESPFYLVMDSDVYARRPFSVGDLVLPSGANGTWRARGGLDQLDFPQPPSWFHESSALLRTGLAGDTDAFCAEFGGVRGKERGGGVAAAAAAAGESGEWFYATGNSTLPKDHPFSLLPPSVAGGGKSVYGACRGGRGHATHVTPMILAKAVVEEVLGPRLKEVSGGGDWVAALLAHQARKEAGCWQALLQRPRFYTWTEYSLYFLAGVASGALDQYHDFSRGGITSFAHSIMLPELYDKADWGGVFTDVADTAPFFIVHSWFGKPLALTNAHLATHIPSIKGVEDLVGGGEGMGGDHPPIPFPSPLPLY